MGLKHIDLLKSSMERLKHDFIFCGSLIKLKETFAVLSDIQGIFLRISFVSLKLLASAKERLKPILPREAI